MRFNPYKIDGPTMVSFSGGRTSAYMLHKILEAFHGKLPKDYVVVFANTGKEMPETLDFVHECQVQWGVPITWVEWEKTEKFVQVTNRTSRSGCTGAIGKNAIVPKRVAEIATPTDEILDFGSGPKSNHVETMTRQGFNVTGYEFGANFNNLNHTFNALHRQYDIVYASNVLNTMDSDKGLCLALDQIAGCTKNLAVVNLPKEPRKNAWTGKVVDVDKLTTYLSERFSEVQIENGRSAPIFVCKKSKVKEAPNYHVGFNIVSHNSASRNGEPFAQLIEKKNYLPNSLARFCTTELKINPMVALMRTIHGVEKWANVIGIRADEQRRFENIKSKTTVWQTKMPLVYDNVTSRDVANFWYNQPFDLRLGGVNGRTPMGNCDLCFLKGAGTLQGIMRDKPGIADWWIKQEAKIDATFAKDRPNYSSLLDVVKRQGDLFSDGTVEADCMCLD